MAFKKICGAIVEGCEKVNSVMDQVDNFSEQIIHDVENNKPAQYARICKAFNLRYPDGSPLKGDDVMEIGKEALEDFRNGHYTSILNYQAIGRLHK